MKARFQDLVTRNVYTELTVERIPALVREVDNLMQTLVTAPLTTGAIDASDELIQRADEVDAFCQSLRPGPLQEIVGKQVTRLRDAAQHLRSPSSRLNAELVNIGVVKPRTRPVPIRVTPFMGSTLARVATKVGGNVKKHQGANSVRKAAKPLYRWEKRRLMRGSTVAQPNVASSKSNAGRTSKPIEEEFLDDVNEARMELHPCSEPGHYSRSSCTKASAATNDPASFEFQIILTEEEFKALKFQRRQLEAEQRHLSRQNQPTSTIPPPAPTAVILERKKSPSEICASTLRTVDKSWQ